ncbi:Uncharacterised protein [uncultured archaeon]|nr:Uncharacterised protein [uncultured archaeon]
MDILEAGDILTPMLLVKAVLAILAVMLFLYYRHYWQKAKLHLPVHYFFTRWRAVRHAAALGLASIGFAIGFGVELAGPQLGLSANKARFVSNIFEIGSLFAMLYVFFELVLDDVPHYQHLSEAAHRHKPVAEAPVQKKAARKRKGKRK